MFMQVRCLMFPLVALGLLIAGPASAAAVSIPSTAAIDLSSATLLNASLESDTTVVGSTHSGSSLTLPLTNAEAGDFLLVFKGAASGLAATFDVTVSDGAGYSVSKSFVQSDTGNWNPPKESHTMLLKALPVGSLTLTLVLTSSSGSYAGNYGAFRIARAADLAVVVPQADGAFVSIQGGVEAGAITLTSCSVDGSNEGRTIGSTGASTEFSFLVYAPELAKYSFVYGSGSKNQAATLNWSLIDGNGARVWPTDGETVADAIEQTTDWTLTQDHEHELGALFEDVYVLKARVSGIDSGFAGNYGNFAFASEALHTFHVTVPAVEHATAAVTANGRSVTAENGVYAVGSNATVVVAYTPDFGFHFADAAATSFTRSAISADWTVEPALTAVPDPEVRIGSFEEGDDYLALASLNGTNATWIINSADVTVAKNLYFARGPSGGGGNSRVSVTVNGGSLTAANGIVFGWGGGSSSELFQNGGAIAVTGSVEPGWGGATTGRVTFAGGVCTISGNLVFCNYGSTAYGTVNGGDVTCNEVWFFNRADAASRAGLEIDSGVLAVKRIVNRSGATAGTGTVTLAGGTLRARQSVGDFLPRTDVLTVTLASGTIDTQGFAVTIPADIQGESMAIVKAGLGVLTFTGSLPASGTITVPKGCGSVVVPAAATGITAGANTDVVEADGVRTFTYSADKVTVTFPVVENAVAHVFVNGYIVATNTTGSVAVEKGSGVTVVYRPAEGYELSGRIVYALGTLNENADLTAEANLPTACVPVVYDNAQEVVTALVGAGHVTVKGRAELNCDWSAFTGDIYVDGDIYFGPDWKGAPLATWHVGGGVYLYSDARQLPMTNALEFGRVEFTAKKRFYMFNGTQDLTIRVGAKNGEDRMASATGIGGYYWNGLAHPAASVTVQKVGTGTLAAGCYGARRWVVESGTVAFLPLTESEVNDYSGDMYQKTCNEMTAAAGATIAGSYGPAPGKGLDAHGLVTLAMASGSTFAPTVGSTWAVTNATLDGVRLRLKDTGKLVHGRTYTLLQARGTFSATDLALTEDSDDFTLDVTADSIRATFNGAGAREVSRANPLVVDFNEILPQIGADGTWTIPNVVLPAGETIASCVRAVATPQTHAVFVVAPDGYGFIACEAGREKIRGAVLVFR